MKPGDPAGSASAPETSTAEAIRSFYRHYHDAIQDKRLDSPYPLRRYVHRTLLASTLESVRPHVQPGSRILDAGCGEGALVMAMAEAFEFQGIRVTGVDLSAPNLEQARRRAGAPFDRRVAFQAADLQALPFADESFDIVVSSHVLEHLPSFEKGLQELRRVTRSIAVLGLPTCLNLCAMVILGGDNYWTISRRTPYALLVGLGRTLGNLRGEGVNEGYIGLEHLPHLWRYPWVLKKQVADAGFEILDFQAPCLPLPYLPGVVPGFMRLQKGLDRLRRAPIFRYFGYGSIVTARKRR